MTLGLCTNISKDVSAWHSIASDKSIYKQYMQWNFISVTSNIDLRFSPEKYLNSCRECYNRELGTSSPFLFTFLKPMVLSRLQSAELGASSWLSWGSCSPHQSEVELHFLYFQSIPVLSCVDQEFYRGPSHPGPAQQDKICVAKFFIKQSRLFHSEELVYLSETMEEIHGNIISSQFIIRIPWTIQWWPEVERETQ